MHLDQKVYCTLNTLRFVPEKYVSEQGNTISLTDGKNFELMIYLGKSDTDYEYEVKVYSSNSYIPNRLDEGIENFERINDYTTFYFNEFYYATFFIQSLLSRHIEFKVRPLKQV